MLPMQRMLNISRCRLIALNSVNLNNNLIMKVDNVFYRVNLSANQSNYTLEKTNLLDENTVVEVK